MHRLDPQPRRRLVVVTCMDVRIDPLAVLGLDPGDAHVLRNAGGIVTEDTLRSLTISQSLLGTRRIALVHHTDCGLSRVADDAFAEELAARCGERPSWTAGGFTDVEESVRAGAQRILGSPFLEVEDVRGYVYDVADGALREVPLDVAQPA